MMKLDEIRISSFRIITNYIVYFTLKSKITLVRIMDFQLKIYHYFMTFCISVFTLYEMIK